MIICMCGGGCMGVWDAHALACVEVTGQLCELSSIFLPSCAFWSLNSGRQCRKRFFPLNHLRPPSGLILWHGTP